MAVKEKLRHWIFFYEQKKKNGFDLFILLLLKILLHTYSVWYLLGAGSSGRGEWVETTLLQVLRFRKNCRCHTKRGCLPNKIRLALYNLHRQNSHLQDSKPRNLHQILAADRFFFFFLWYIFLGQNRYYGRGVRKSTPIVPLTALRGFIQLFIKYNNSVSISQLCLYHVCSSRLLCYSGERFDSSLESHFCLGKTNRKILK